MTKLRAVLRRRWPILVVCLALGVAGGVLSSQFARQNVQRLFTAQQVIVANSSSGANSLVSQDTLKVTRGEVPVLAAERLDSDLEPSALARKVVALFDSKTSAITVASNDVDPKAASRRVEAFVEAFLETVNARIQEGDRNQLRQLQTDLETARADLAQFDVDYPWFTRPGTAPPTGLDPLVQQTLASTRSNLVNRVNTLDSDVRDRNLDLLQNQPYESLGPEEPRPAQTSLIDVPAGKPARAALVGLLGLLLGAGLVMLIERVNRRIDTRDELVEITDLPVLAEIGFVPERRRAVDAHGRVALAGIWAEPYRRVRSAIQFVQANAGTGGWTPTPGSPAQVYGTAPSVFLVTSTSPDEGKSTTSALVALALAEVGVPTVLVGGDFRKPQADRLVGAQRNPSLQDLASLDVNRPTVDEIVQATPVDNLYVAAAGDATREVAGLVDAAKTVCAEAVARGATVVIDSSPLQAANDTLDLLPVVDYVILVLRVGRSGEDDLLDTIATLQRMESKLLGIVLIGTPAARRQEYYYDYYSHGPLPESIRGGATGTAVPAPQPAAQPPAQDAPADGSTPEPQQPEGTEAPVSAERT